ncbi:hypothetical protein [Brachyspira pulli]|uniref:hypothetical protein n=1 Tax=Brachyspira pulli TaxID=310721 RepID=UPI0030044D87
MNKIFLLFLVFAVNIYAFDEGFIWGVKANFNGTATLPSMHDSDLKKLSMKDMNGAVGYTMDGELELGYLFGSERWFNMNNEKFSGMSLFGYLGIGNGFLGQNFSGTLTDAGTQKEVRIFVNLTYTPVMNFGVGTRVYLLKSRLSLGLMLGGKVILTKSPEAYVYADDPSSVNSIADVNLPQIGQVVVSDAFNKSVTRLMLSVKFMLEYNQPITDNVELVLGAYTRFNMYNPKYLIMPSSVEKVINKFEGQDGSLKLENTKLPSYYINSLDFGLSIGFAFSASSKE